MTPRRSTLLPFLVVLATITTAWPAWASSSVSLRDASGSIVATYDGPHLVHETRGDAVLGQVRRVMWDGVDHPLFLFDAPTGRGVWFELDTTGNVRRLRGHLKLRCGSVEPGAARAGESIAGYRYTAFGILLPGDAQHPSPPPEAQCDPAEPTVPLRNPFGWQGHYRLPDAGGLYDFRTRTWSPELGAFLQPDGFEYLEGAGTLWSWPGQNPYRWRDPDGRIGSDGESTDRAIHSPQDWSDPQFQRGMSAGAEVALYASALIGPGSIVPAVRAIVAAARSGNLAARAVQAAAAAVGALKGCGAGARGAAETVAKFDPSRAGHIFRQAPGHVNPGSAGSQSRFASLFERVGSNPANLRADAVQAGLITEEAAQAGVQAFTWTGETGQVWVTVRNGTIRNAGVNRAGAFR